MKRILATLMIGLMLMSSLSVLAVQAIGTDSTDGGNLPDGWYTSWFRDTDRDRIDDLLQGSDAPGTGSDDKVEVFVDFHRSVKDQDIDVLSLFGSVTYIDPYIDVVAVSDLGTEDLYDIAGLPGVVMVEKQVPLVPLLNISAPAIRAVSSTTYTHGAWDLGYNGSGIVIAIFDTGVDNNIHDSLDDLDDDPMTDDPKFVAGVDVTGVINVEGDPDPGDGHGTHVAGIALGTGGGSGQFVGIAPRAQLADVKVLPAVGTGNPVDFLEGLAWCRNNMDQYGIRVLSMSLGTQGFSDGNDTLSRAVNDAVTRDGLIVVAAMGNDGSTGVPAPAAADEAIAVGAYDDYNTISRADDAITTFSNKGPRTADNDEEDLDELKPDISAPGVSIMSAQMHTPGVYIAETGTSQSTPHVAGVVALMLHANPYLQPEDVKQILRDTAQAKGVAYDSDLDPKYNTGYGWGMVDAFGAVKRAADLKAGGTLVGPPSVSGGTSGSFTSKFKFTKTEFESTPLNATFRVTAPRSWGKPSNVAITSSEGVTYTTGHSDPVQGLTDWTLDAWARYTGTVTSPIELEPTLSFTSFAPVDQGAYTFGMTPLLNGVSGNSTNTTVQVIPGSGGKPDFYLTSGDITFSNDNPLAGAFVSISANIHNGGNIGSNVNISFYDGHPDTGLFLGWDTVSVAPGGTDTASVIWIATPGSHSIHVVADRLNNVNETNENNNMANRTISVTGFNNPPTAALSVDPSTVGVGMPVILSGSGSTDVDGIVVLYNYDFGDGNTSGWVPLPNITYIYTVPGLYRTSLTVQDNGGAQSTNAAEVQVNVLPTTTKTRTMYMHSGSRLLFTQPDSHTSEKAALPDGFVPITPGSPFGTVESREVGSWVSNLFKKNMTVSGTIGFHVWVNNTGTESIEVTNFTFNLYHNDSIAVQAVSAALDFISPGIPTEITATTSVGEIALVDGDYLDLNIWCAVNGDTGVLEYESIEMDSGVDLTFTSFQGIPPVVDAGQNFSIRVDEVAEFIPSASDEDGSVIKYEWDFEGDGAYDYLSSSNGVTTHEYTATGIYNATIRVTDNDGDTATDRVTVTVRPENRPPVIKDTDPPTSTVSMDAGKTKTFTIVISDPDEDPLTVKWSLDGRKKTEQGTIFTYAPMDDDVGSHELEVSVSDGEATTVHVWTVIVNAVNHPPVLKGSSPTTYYVIITEEDSKLFSVDVTDADDDELTYKWAVDAVMVGTGKNYVFIADVDSVGVHVVEVEVTDGEFSVYANWTLEVQSLNNPPSISFMTPFDGDVFNTKSTVFFEVDANDPDGDALKYTWTSSIDGQLGKQSSFQLTLSNGTHSITVKVEDGRGGSVSKTVVITIKKAREETEPRGNVGVTLAAVVMVMALVIGLFMFQRRQHAIALQRMAYEQRRKALGKGRAKGKGRRRQKGAAGGAVAGAAAKRRRKRSEVVEHGIEDEERELEQMFAPRPYQDAPTPPPKRVIPKRRTRLVRHAVQDEEEEIDDMFEPRDEVDELPPLPSKVKKRRVKRTAIMKHGLDDEEDELEDMFGYKDEEDDLIDDDRPVKRRIMPKRTVKKVRKRGPDD